MTVAMLERGSFHVSDEPPFEHVPVLLGEVIELFATVDEGMLVDLTLGGGGHSAALLEAHPGLTVLGIDRDPVALAAAADRLRPWASRVACVQARFDAVGELAPAMAARRGIPVVGVLADLGVSSPQLDRADRGFSYRHEAPLDMRMGPDAHRTAADVVNTYEAEDLARILRAYGDERFAPRIARAIVAARPLHTTVELAEVVRAAIPAATRRHGGHPAKRTFQAVRIEVNDELHALRVAIDEALKVLAPGGRLVVISYHSGEDRIVKAAMREAVTGGCTCPPHLPCGCGARATARNLTRGGITPGLEELARNRRAASARLRAVARLADEAEDSTPRSEK